MVRFRGGKVSSGSQEDGPEGGMRRRRWGTGPARADEGRPGWLQQREEVGLFERLVEWNRLCEVGREREEQAVPVLTGLLLTCPL